MKNEFLLGLAAGIVSIRLDAVLVIVAHVIAARAKRPKAAKEARND